VRGVRRILLLLALVPPLRDAIDGECATGGGVAAGSKGVGEDGGCVADDKVADN